MAVISVINNTKYMKRRTEKIQYIVLHYSASTKSSKGSAMQTVRTLDSRGYSSDYAVDDDTIIQFADDPTKWRSTACQSPSSSGTSAGKNATNNNSVSIEMSSVLGKGGKWEANDPNFRFSSQVLNNTAYLCKKLIQEYNIPKQNIVRHFDIVGKSCPGIIGWNKGKGSDNENEFLAFVESLYDNKSPQPETNYEYDYSLYEDNQSKNKKTSTNSVSRLSDVSRQKNISEILKQTNGRKKEFETLASEMANNVPELGRDILITSEFYDSNIIKETKKDES